MDTIIRKATIEDVAAVTGIYGRLYALEEAVPVSIG